MRYSTTQKLGVKIDKRRVMPNIRGVNAQPVQVLGMVKVSIVVGDRFTRWFWVPVIPDAFINRDVLLGMDVIGLVDFSWKAGMENIQWGDCLCDVYYIRQSGNCIQSISSSHMPTTTKYVQNTRQINIRGYKSVIQMVKIKEDPGTTVILKPHKRFCPQEQSILATVNDNGQIPLILTNHSKAVMRIKPSCLLATYDICEGDAVETSSSLHTISNELIPPKPNELPGNSRREKLVNLIKHQKWDHLASEQKEQLKDLILNNTNLFILDDNDLGCIKTSPAHIHVKDKTPVKTAMYRYPIQSRQIISNMLEDMLNKGVIEYSNAAWMSPIVLVNKPDGSKRMCLDFRRVNSHLAADVYPLPRLDELISSVAGHRYYATLDLKEAYFQITLDQQSRDLTTFSDGASLFRFVRLPFGLSCAPAIFSRKMTELLTPLAKCGWVRNYLDDLVVTADTYGDLLERLSILFKLLNEKGVKLNLDKCDLVRTKVKFLGHIISSDGCSPDPNNVKAINEMETPKNVKDVRRFIGMCSFYRRFVPFFSNISKCLTSLTSKNSKFEWTQQHQDAFVKLKHKLTTAPVLTTYNPALSLVLVTDASEECVGGVLHQRGHDHSLRPLGYFSKKLTPTELKWNITDKEAYAIVLCCRNFSTFLWGRHFTIQTDHQPLVSIFKTKTKCPRVTRWLLEMREYSFDISYLKGTLNFVADCLSRPATVHTLVASNNSTGEWLGLEKDEFRDLQRQDPVYKEIIDYLECTKLPTKRSLKHFSDNFELKDQILYYLKTLKTGITYRLVVPQSLISVAIESIHDRCGHFGTYKSIGKAESLYYWRCQKSTIDYYIRRCSICNQYKVGSRYHRNVNEIPEVSNPLDRIAIDLIDLHGSTEGFRYVLTIIDHYSRFCKFYPLKNKNAEGIEACLGRFTNDFGIPKIILLDNSLEFRSATLTNWAKQFNIKLQYTSPYNPRANGCIERMHSTLKGCLARLCLGYPNRWPKMLATCQSLLNNSLHISLNVTPFYAFFHRHNNDFPQDTIPAVIPNTDSKVIKDMIVESSKLSTTKYNKVANRKNRKVDKLSVGDLVWVRCEKTLPGTCAKLNLKYTGPYRVTKVIGDHLSYEVMDVQHEQTLRRTIDKLKPYISESYIVPEMRKKVVWTENRKEEVQERGIKDCTPQLRPVRQRQAPRRLIETI